MQRDKPSNPKLFLFLFVPLFATRGSVFLPFLLWPPVFRDVISVRQKEAILKTAACVFAWAL